MFENIRSRFTKWYVKRGYTFSYDFTGVDVYSDGILCTPMGVPDSHFKCPFWVRPLLIFFSPSVYTMETWGRSIYEGLMRGIKEGAMKYVKGEEEI